MAFVWTVATKSIGITTLHVIQFMVNKAYSIRLSV